MEKILTAPQVDIYFDTNKPFFFLRRRNLQLMGEPTEEMVFYLFFSAERNQRGKTGKR
ncbi:hypothetical protein HDC90_002306 [Pedobacter sp. AK013]|uniref:hypothetical protein n=1 Tax=Pedobacter sp. AK013 TaxID=2723071 RepID=UPI00161673FF|nr:hypothetical protein [Pedobacter sp. AK013]MBB6237684.1 hypothetical protein [Pedobacter sp. AK013]